MSTVSWNPKLASAPYVSLEPGPSVETDRPVKIAPMLLRRSRSRLIRRTEKFVGAASVAGSSPVWMFIAPTVNCPTRPVRRPPACIGTSRPWLSPIRRL